MQSAQVNPDLVSLQTAGRMEIDQDRCGAPWQRQDRIAAGGLVGAVVLWNLVSLRQTTVKVSYLNDSAMHEEMVRFSSLMLASGRWPASSWFPYLNIGSPHFLHYQPLGAILAGALGAIASPDVVFRWSLYLLWCFWPVAIYISARILRIPVLAAGIAATLSPFILSVPGIGYEQRAYVWVGYGMWAQLCASWTLPLAWATTWRALEDRRWMFASILTTSLTVGFHFETGYLALAAILMMPVLAISQLKSRLLNAGALLVGSILAASWVLIPLLTQSRWAAINTYLSHTGLARGYGARQDLHWLVTGGTFDASRIPVITVAVGVGIIFGCTTYRRFSSAKPLLAMFVVCLLLSFGPTSWGDLISLIPGHADIFFRRFVMGVQLSGIYLAGLGIYFAATSLVSWIAPAISRAARSGLTLDAKNWWRLGVALVLVALVALPAAANLGVYDSHNAAMIGAQARAEAKIAPSVHPMIDYLNARHDGRVYAGDPNNWGNTFRVGYVPVYKYLANFDVDEVGFDLRTASLMSQPEANFDEGNPSDYPMFGIRYLLLPRGRRPFVPASLTMASGNYTLWTVERSGYLSIVQISGLEYQNRGTIIPSALSTIQSDNFSRGLDPLVVWTSRRTGVSSLDADWSSKGEKMTSQRTNLAQGWASAIVKLTRPGILALSTSYDPGWSATTDSRPTSVFAMAPAIIGIRLSAGHHKVVLSFHGFQYFPELVGLSLATLALVAHRTLRTTYWSK